MDVKVYPAKLSGCVRAIDSKSAAHRAIFVAALCDEEVKIHLASTSDDIKASLGAAHAIREGADTVDCAECGATLRFALPVAAALGSNARFIGHGRLPERPIGPLVDAMKEHGCTFSSDKLPLDLGGRLEGGVFTLPGNVSSQFVSGLLIALPAVGGGEIRLTTQLESKGYVDMTRAVLRDFGIEVQETENGYIVPAEQKYASPGEYTIEGDWSNAAFFLAANLLGGSVEVTGLREDSAQPDREIASLVKELKDLDASVAPDLAPIMAAVYALTPGTWRVRNGARLRAKESDRLTALADCLREIGADIRVDGDELEIHGRETLPGGTADARGDHRLAMALAIAACSAKEPVIIRGAQAVNKSYPGFFDDLRSLGGRVDVL
ncbi:MAG: 3-phosphoshikimate 1-carboxyvinyltransferase [Clostridiales bacterium]|nr:3-phosphoshikimate 1-carboxyvinyltransferase [Clostridiales bacterium]